MHVIQLRGPWKLQRLPTDDSESAIETVRLPQDWRDVVGPVAARVRFARNFHAPTGLTARHSVHVTLTGYGGSGHVRLNGQPLGPLEPLALSARFSILPVLQPFNTLEIELTFDPDTTDRPGGLWQPTVLEIRDPEEAEA